MAASRWHTLQSPDRLRQASMPMRRRRRRPPEGHRPSPGLDQGISNAGGRLRTRPGPRCAMRSLMTRHSRPAPVRYPSGRQPADVPRSRRPPRAGTEGVSWPLHRDSGWKRRGSTTRKQIEGARTRRDANRRHPGRIGGSREQTETACSLMACKRSSVRARLAPTSRKGTYFSISARPARADGPPGGCQGVPVPIGA